MKEACCSLGRSLLSVCCDGSQERLYHERDKGQELFITNVIFSERLNLLMKRRKITQTALRKATGISQAALSYYCGGRAPTSEHLCRLADYFGITMDALWGRLPLNIPEPPDPKVSAALNSVIEGSLSKTRSESKTRPAGGSE